MRERRNRDRICLVICWACIVVTGIQLSVTGEAATTSVSLSEWDAFTLDVDGDGEAEFEGSLSNAQNVALLSRFDSALATHEFPGLLPGQGAGGSSNQFTTMAELEASDIFSGDVRPVTPLFGDLHLGTSVVVLNANKAKPIWGGWRFGTSGSGNDPFEVIGFVLDTSAFFQSEGAAPIELHTFHYGAVALGENLMNLSLASALGGEAPSPVIPEPSVPFELTATFEGPWRGSISVTSQLGKSYQLHRSLDLLSSGVAESKPGTGGVLSFQFDDSLAPSNQAFYWVTESELP